REDHQARDIARGGGAARQAALDVRRVEPRRAQGPEGADDAAATEGHDCRDLQEGQARQHSTATGTHHRAGTGNRRAPSALGEKRVRVPAIVTDTITPHKRPPAGTRVSWLGLATPRFLPSS